MGRASTKKDKNVYQTTRENLGLSREKASEITCIPSARIEYIEKGNCPRPDEVRDMAKAYQEPNLCNYFCSRQCAIGQLHVPEIPKKELAQIILEVLDSLRATGEEKERLIEISVDGAIANDELDDFIHIQKELERISTTVEALRLWSERMLATGKINMEQYELRKRQIKD